jgi:uncharacterized protein YggE
MIPTKTFAWICATCATLALSQIALGQGAARPQDQPPPGGPGGQPPARAMPLGGGTLRVGGDGQIQVAPDHATVRVGATAQAEDASAAQDQVNQVMQKALASLREMGIAEEKIQTSDLSLWPVYDQPQPDDRGMMRPPNIVGYQASNVVSVELDDLTKIGAVIDACVAAGANQLQGVQFGLRNDTRAKSEALRRAVAAARTKAEVLAQAAGLQLGALAELNEAGVDFQPPQPMRGRMAMEMAADTQVQPGQLTVTARVTLVYRLRGEGGPPPQGDRPPPPGDRPPSRPAE